MITLVHLLALRQALRAPFARFIKITAGVGVGAGLRGTIFRKDARAARRVCFAKIAEITEASRFGAHFNAGFRHFAAGWFAHSSACAVFLVRRACSGRFGLYGTLIWGNAFATRYVADHAVHAETSFNALLDATESDCVVDAVRLTSSSAPFIFLVCITWSSCGRLYETLIGSNAVAARYIADHAFRAKTSWDAFRRAKYLLIVVGAVQLASRSTLAVFLVRRACSGRGSAGSLGGTILWRNARTACCVCYAKIASITEASWIGACSNANRVGVAAGWLAMISAFPPNLILGTALTSSQRCEGCHGKDCSDD